MSTATLSSKKTHLADVWADPELILGLLRQQFRWGELRTAHPDADMSSLIGLESADTKCKIVVNSVIYHDCELEGFGSGPNGFVLFLSYDVDVDGDGAPRKLTWANLSIETGFPEIVFGNKAIDIVDGGWDFTSTMLAFFS